MQSFFLKEAKQAKGCVRVNSAKFVDEQTVKELFFLLGKSVASKSVLQFFGVSAGAMGKTDLLSAGLRQCFLASLKSEQLEENCRCALELLAFSPRAPRSYFIRTDETVRRQDYQAVSGLRSAGE